MRLSQSLTRKLVFCGALIAATAAAYPATAQYYYGCPAGFYLAPGYGCVPYDAYSPYYYGYAPSYAGVWGGGWGGWGGWHHGWGGWHLGGFGHGFAHGGFGHGGGGHGGGGHGR